MNHLPRELRRPRLRSRPLLPLHRKFEPTINVALQLEVTEEKRVFLHTNYSYGLHFLVHIAAQQRIKYMHTPRSQSRKQRWLLQLDRLKIKLWTSRRWIIVQMTRQNGENPINSQTTACNCTCGNAGHFRRKRTRQSGWQATSSIRNNSKLKSSKI